MVVMDELLDLVDCNDQVIGQEWRSVIYSQGNSNFRVVNAFLMNENGQLWIPRRCATKTIFPSCLDTSMGGHVMVGDTYEQAFKRELIEELNLDASLISYELIGKLNPYQHDMSAFMQVYLIKTNTVPNYNQKDFSEYFWLKPHEILTVLASGDQSKSDLPKIVKILF